MRTIYLALICSALLSTESTAQSEERNVTTDSQIEIYHRYLDMALNNWCVFFDNTGLDPIAYNSESAYTLSGEAYSESLHKKLLLAALKCEYGAKRLTYIDALIDKEFVSENEKKNLLTYAFIYTYNHKEIKGNHSKYKKSLDKLLVKEEIKMLEQNSKNQHIELISFDQIFQP